MKFRKKKDESLSCCLDRAVHRLLMAHNLLEYCCIINMFKSETKRCVLTVKLLSYNVDALECELASHSCSQRTLDTIVEFSESVSVNTDLLTDKMADFCDTVKPTKSFAGFRRP